MTKNNSGLSGLIFFIVLGFFLLFYNRIIIFSPFFITIMVAVVGLCIMLSALGIKSSRQGNQHFNKKIPLDNYKIKSTNPYISQNDQKTLQKRVVQKEMVKEKPVLSMYCQFCGVKREKDALYCHNCGTKLYLD